MHFSLAMLYPALPELFILGMACLILLLDAFRPKQTFLQWSLVQLSLLVAGVMLIILYPHTPVVTFGASFILDPVACLLKLAVLASAFLLFFYTRDFMSERGVATADYYLLSVFSLLGLMVLASANSLMTIYLGLELFSLPLYALIALQRDRLMATEAAMKYFVMGALASATLLYGMSMLYGATHSLQLSHIAQVVHLAASQHGLILVFGLVFVMVGVAFKLGGVPFHMWVPDVYQGAPTGITAFIAGVSKFAAFVLVYRLLLIALPDLQFQWQHMLLFIAVLSIALGNIAAIVQDNVKRLLAYSAIAQLGYVTLGFVSGTPVGYGAALFYLITYSFTSLAAFGVLTLLSRQAVDVETLTDLQGLNHRNPWLAFLLLLVMFSMAGIPPIIGFFAKLGILEALISAHMTWLAVYALFFAVVGAYYYLRVVKVLYFDTPVHHEPYVIANDGAWVISINGLAILLLGIFPGALFDVCHRAFM